MTRRTKAERREIYESYINSAAWEKKRQLVLERDNHTCRKCGRKQSSGLHVHHLTYRYFHEEPIGDLITLCRKCHEGEHKKPVAKRLKLIKKQPGVCVICRTTFSTKSFPKGGGWYCSYECKRKSPKNLTKTVKGKQAAARLTVKLNPVTLRERGTQAAIEEHNWKNL